jgi:hypothetical protein
MENSNHFTHSKLISLSLSKVCIDLYKFQAVWMRKCKTVCISLQNGPLKFSLIHVRGKAFVFYIPNSYCITFIFRRIDAFSLERQFL